MDSTKILIVDDEPDILEFLKYNLVKEGFDVLAASDGHRHPVFGLWRVSLHDALAEALTEEGERKIDRFAARYHVATADFPALP